MANEKRLIDANAFKEFLEDVRQAYLEEDTLSSDFAACLIETVQDEYLALTPTVDAVEVLRGQWIPVMTHEVCSHCGYEINRGEQIRAIFLLDNKHCRWCGAKMDGGEW